MFYPNYDDYMRDVFYFNGLSNPNGMYCMNNNTNTTLLSNLYPSIYRIINPVVQRVINGNNYQFINEETVNNIVDTVYGIVEGDVSNMERENSPDVRRTTTSSNSSQTNTNSNNTNNVANNNNSNNLVRDLIKILVIKELINRNNVRRFPFTYGGGMPYYMNGQIPPYMVN